MHYNHICYPFGKSLPWKLLAHLKNQKSKQWLSERYTS